MKHKVKDIVRITLDGNEAPGCGQDHGFKVGELARIVAINDASYRVEHLDGSNWWIINDECCEATEAEPKGAQKFDDDKIKMELIPYDALAVIATIFTLGAKKYSARNWEQGLPFSRLFAALQRHITAWFQGEDKDPETGKSHLWHAGCCIMMLIALELRRPDLDDRPKVEFHTCK